MPIPKKIYEYRLSGRGIVTNTALAVAQDNLTVALDDVVINGRDVPLAALNTTQKNNITAAVETLVSLYDDIPTYVSQVMNPTLVSATVAADGVTLTAVFTQDLTSAAFDGGFTVLADDVAVSISDAEESAGTITFTVDTIYADQVVTIAYADDDGDVTGPYLMLESFDATAVTNDSEEEAP